MQCNPIDGFFQPMNLHQNILENIPGFIAVTDMQSRTIYTNSYTARLFGFGSKDKMLGKGPFDMCCPAVDSAHLFMEQDEIVRETQKTLTMLDIHVYADGASKVLLTKKNPYYEEGKLAGSVYLCTEMYIDSLMKLTSLLMNSDKKYHLHSETGRSYQIMPPDLHPTLSMREMECVFYILRGGTQKTIAKKINLSPRTVESYINSAKLKLNCRSKNQLIESCLAKGYINYIPSSIITKNISGILHIIE